MIESTQQAPTEAPLSVETEAIAQQPATEPEVEVRRPRLRVPGFLGELVRTVVFVVLATALFDLAIPRSVVEGSSMVPTFHDGDRLVISRVHLLFGEINYNDIVVFNSMNVNEPNTMIIKRIIGLPGDTIEFRQQHVYRNGEELAEDYINEECTAFKCPDQMTTLGPEEYFVMGDNRNHSLDSRRYGAVTLDHMVGRVVLRYWPLDAIGPIDE
ncbi:MAG: signal peptidase I [Anaerolineaceae bacterium]|nr:signal peptidase I [Anaerolineaceae bacterium]